MRLYENGLNQEEVRDINVSAGYSVAQSGSQIFYGDKHKSVISVIDKYQTYFGFFSCDYGHGLEHFSTLIVKENKKDKLIIRKVTGDPNVPAGKISVKCDSVPKIGEVVSDKF